MNRIVSLLWFIILIEVAICGRTVWQRANRVNPPTVSLAELDQETARAISDLETNTKTGTADDWRELAQAYLGEGFFPQAEQAFGRAVRLDPTDEQSLYGQGFCLERMGQMKRAVSLFDQLVDSNNPQLAQTCWYQIGRNHLRLEDWQNAEQAFRQIVDFPPAAYQLAKLLIRTDRVEEGVILAQQQLEKLPNSLKMTQLLTYAAELSDDHQLARERRRAVERAEYQLTLEYGISYISLFRGKMGLQKQLSGCLKLKDSGSLADRAACLDRALEIIEDNGFLNYQSVYIAAAQVAVAEDRLEDALMLLGILQKQGYVTLEVLELWGDVYHQQNDAQKSRELWQRAVHLVPTSELHFKLAQSFEESNDAESSRVHEGFAHFFKGTDYYRHNRLESAETSLAEAARLIPDYADIWYFLGEVQLAQGSKNDSRKSFENSLAINPEHGRALDALEYLEEREH